MKEIRVEFSWNLNLEEAKKQGKIILVIGYIGSSLSPVYRARWCPMKATWINVDTNTPFKEFVIKAWANEKDILPKNL